jgi:hypothetical protein
MFSTCPTKVSGSYCQVPSDPASSLEIALRTLCLQSPESYHLQPKLPTYSASLWQFKVLSYLFLCLTDILTTSSAYKPSTSSGQNRLLWWLLLACPLLVLLESWMTSYVVSLSLFGLCSKLDLWWGYILVNPSQVETILSQTALNIPDLPNVPA